MLGGRGPRVHVQLGEGEAGVLAVEAVLADLAPQQLVPRALEARPGPGPQPPVCGPCSRWPRFRWSRAAKLRTSAASFGSSAAAWHTRDTGTGESTLHQEAG